MRRIELFVYNCTPNNGAEQGSDVIIDEFFGEVIMTVNGEPDADFLDGMKEEAHV